MKIAFHTLGCKVNQYETEAMAARFKERGHVIVGEDEFADVYVVNTCTVTAMADRKSRQFIRRMKKKNPDSIIAVTGCYVQIDPDSVASIEGVDIITGINEKSSLPDYVEEYAKATNVGEHDHVWKHIRSYDDLGVYEDLGTVTSAENRTRAYIKVQDGCNRFCSYCVIPYARGAVRSRPLEQIVEEARSLIEAGYKEIVLTGINTALYGEMEAESSGDEVRGIETVIAALDKLEGDFRIRLSSLEPTVVDAEYVKKLMKYDKLCHHLHLSAQSGSDRVLKEMNRSYTVEEYEDIVGILRDFDPLYGVSADIIAGFPGETDEDVEKSAGLIRRCGFCRTHIFRYSNRPGTRASQRTDQISASEKTHRSNRLQQVADEAEKKFLAASTGDVRRVLIEEYLPDEGAFTGYTDNYIKVYIKSDSEDLLKVNTFEDVELKAPYLDGMEANMLILREN